MNTKAIVLGIKAQMQKTKVGKIQTGIKSAIDQGKSVKGKGRTILERLGEELSSSGGKYKDCKNPQDAATVLLSQLERVLGSQHQLVYKSDSLLLISIDGAFYEITISDMKAGILRMAQKAGIPAMFSGTNLARLLIEGFIKYWKKKDPAYSEQNFLLE